MMKHIYKKSRKKILTTKVLNLKMSKVFVTLFAFLLISVVSEAQEKGNIEYNIEKTKSGEVTITVGSSNVSYIEIYKNFPEMILVETIDFENIDKIVRDNLLPAIYVFALKDRNDKVVALKSIQID